MEEIVGCEKEGAVCAEWAALPFGEAVGAWAEVFGGKGCLRVGEAAMHQLEGELVKRLAELCAPVFVLEMHIVGMQQGLQGTTGEERYRDYVRRFLGDAGYLGGVFEEYGVMREWVEVAVRLWRAKVEEFFERLEGDYEGLKERFGVEGEVVEVGTGLADPHNGNRSVYELTFKNGVSIFYKPKSMGVDVIYNGLLSELNERGLPLGMKTFRVWDRESYGWSEKVECLPCGSEEDVKSFYMRSGMLLGLFYLLGGTDLHHENVIASGAYPVVIDLESLLHADLSTKSTVDNPKAWKQSVLRVGLLPSFLMGELGLKGVDISGLGGRGGQKSPTFVPRWEALNTDEMRLKYEQPVTSSEKNGVYLDGRLCFSKDYLQEIVQGFKTVYSFVDEHKEVFLGRGGLLDRFAKVPVRCICRPTRLYFKLLQQLLDPARLRDRGRHAEVLDILPRYLLEMGSEHLGPVVEEELRAMQQRDIPFFQALPEGRDLYLNGEMIIEGALDEPALETARRRIEEMSDEMCAEQVDLIEQSFYVVGYESKKRGTGCAHSNEGEVLSDEELFEEAKRIGQMIVERGRRDRLGGLRWVGVEYLPSEEQAVLAPLSRSLYGGVMGLALFFGALYRVSGDPKWKEVAMASLREFLESLEEKSVDRLPGALGLGGMAGVGSFIYTLGHLSEWLEEPHLFERAHFVTTLIQERHIASDESCDVIGGGAGLILALLSLHNKSMDAEHLALAQRVGDHLVGSKKREAEGVSWGNRGLVGFSHGVAGIAYALECLAKRLSNELYLETVSEAFAYQSSLFSKEAQNWPDLRPDKLRFQAAAWCHGAPGIGLALACSSRLARDPVVLEEIKAAVGTTERSFSHAVQHLCCGDTGRADILMTIGEKTGDGSLKDLARQKIAAAVRQAHQRGHYCFGEMLSTQVFSPGFMQGLSGIGYTLLRHTAEGKSLPNVLVLE